MKVKEETFELTYIVQRKLSLVNWFSLGKKGRNKFSALFFSHSNAINSKHYPGFAQEPDLSSDRMSGFSTRKSF